MSSEAEGLRRDLASARERCEKLERMFRAEQKRAAEAEDARNALAREARWAQEFKREKQTIRQALIGSLRYSRSDHVAWRAGDGELITIGQMIAWLETENPLAMGYIDDVIGAAVRVIRVHAKGLPGHAAEEER